MSDLVECRECGGFFPRLPGIPKSIDVPIAHTMNVHGAGDVREDGTIRGPTIIAVPCSTRGIEFARKMYHLGQAAIFAALDLWSADLVEEVPLPEPDEEHPPQLVAGLDGRSRHDGMLW